MNDELWIRRCLQLAAGGSFTASPNPLVGAVVVHDGQIIGEGWHHRAGEAHAEVNALARVRDESLLAQSTLYVNLEPCAHHGRTPPCADLIIAKKIPRVVVGSRDPFSAVNGKGLERLRQAGVEVTCPVLEGDCEMLNRRFFTFHRMQRPYIILKWAQTADGFLAPPHSKKRQVHWISHPDTASLTHRWRAREDAILIGAETLRQDNPALTLRHAEGRPPQRILLSRQGQWPANSQLLQGDPPAWIFSESKPTHPGNAHWWPLKEKNNALEQVLHTAYEKDLQSILVEGGRQVLEQFIEAGLWDEARVITAPHYAKGGVAAPRWNAVPAREYYFGPDHIKIYFH